MSTDTSTLVAKRSRRSVDAPAETGKAGVGGRTRFGDATRVPRRTVRQCLRRGLEFVLPPSWYLCRGVGGNVIRQHVPERVPVMLTFDDGPHPEYTPRLLDRLAEVGWRATFFVVGQNVERNPELVHRIVAEGHAIGNHTYSHGEPSRVGLRAFCSEILRTNAVLEDVTGRPCRLFRPPKGKLTVGKMLAVWRAGMTIVLWNRDPKDFAMPSAEPMRRWVAEYSVTPGDIVLLHDTHPHASAALEVWWPATENRDADSENRANNADNTNNTNDTDKTNGTVRSPRPIVSVSVSDWLGGRLDTVACGLLPTGR